MAIEGVIFDLDGVLIDSADAHLESWKRLAERHGRAVTAEQFSATFGRQNRDILPVLWDRPLSERELADLGEQKEAIYRDLVRGRVGDLAMGGAVDLVVACHQQGLRLAIGSSTPPENVELALAELGVRSRFSALITSREVRRGKPDPEVFLKAAAQLGLDPSQCVVIEDAPSGIDAAKAAGCAAVALTSQHPRDRLALADRVVDSLTELSPGAIRMLARRDP